MPKMTLKQAISKQAAARSRYAAAAREFRESMAELGALDQMLSNRGVDNCHGFGEHPPATISAPEATEPSTVTSPSLKID